MTRTIWRWALLAIVTSGLVSGCGGTNAPAEVKPDPALANKPFPKVGEPQKQP